ncbi:hypothetical protein KKG45_08435 [bacterium]|nr:hypothetical protein [bacterium]MBU1073261.1 hypothetical protein [bacterium]MBU1676720.1 hypothetical protein [bacterium]
MASKQSGSSPNTFYEVVLCGPHEMIHGLLAGLSIGAGHEAMIVFGHERGISDRSLREKLSEILHPGAHQCQVILDNVTRALLGRKAKRVSAETGVSIVSDRKISSAEFKFSYLAYAPRYAAEISTLLDELPEGVRLVSHKHQENIDPSAKGAEGYTPVHDYEAKGSGEIRGRFDLVLDAHAEFDRHPLIEIEDIELELV